MCHVLAVARLSCCGCDDGEINGKNTRHTSGINTVTLVVVVLVLVTLVVVVLVLVTLVVVVAVIFYKDYIKKKLKNKIQQQQQQLVQLQLTMCCHMQSCPTPMDSVWVGVSLLIMTVSA